MRLYITAFLVVTCLAATTLAGNVQSTITYQSTVSSDANGALDLKAELNYDNSRANAPIAVVMHGFSPGTGILASIRANAQRLRDAGFFAVSVAMRARDGSDGARDSGGLEIYDIHDAVEKVKATYGNYVDASNVHITGYSGGGGNAMSALTKFPDYFRLGSSYFGMSDYGYNSTDGWYNNGAASSHQGVLRTDIGNPNVGDDSVTDRYHARASNLASKNNPYSEIHLFVNGDEVTCPKINSTSYRDNAVAAALFPGEFNNITVHIGQAGTYEDFNGNGQNDADEQQYWPHCFPTANQQHAAETWYLARLLAGQIAQPVLNSSDELFVAGFVKTRPFELWLGDGQNAAGELDYSLSAGSKTFELRVLSLDTAVTGKLSVDTADMAGQAVSVLLNDTLVDTFTGGGIYEYTGLGDGGRLELTVVPEPSTLALSVVGAAVGLLLWRRR